MVCSIITEAVYFGDRPTSINRCAQIFICGRDSKRRSILYKLSFRIGCSCFAARVGTSAYLHHESRPARRTLPFRLSARWAVSLDRVMAIWAGRQRAARPR
jgi:hypothetical protein